MWTELQFGKYKGKTLPQILFLDPDWFFWAVNQEVFLKSPMHIKRQVQIIYKRARSIKIPLDYGNDKVVEYIIDSLTGKFSDISIISNDQPVHVGSSSTARMPVIDLAYPTNVASYDKLGCRIMLKSLKKILFDDCSYKMTRKRCELFFDEESNFDVKKV